MFRFYSLLLMAACSVPRSRPVSIPEDGPRRVHLYVPETPPPAGGMPLVVMLHGAHGTPDRTERGTAWTRLAAEEGFVIAYPEGIDRTWNDGRSDKVPATAAGADDIAWLNKVLEHLTTRYPVDPDRIVLTGTSNGGMLAWRWMCQQEGRVSVFAPVIAGLPKPSLAGCAPHPTAALVIQAEADPLVPIRGGTVGQDRGSVAPLEVSIGILQQANGCDASTGTQASFDALPNDGLSASQTTWPSCSGPPVSLIRLHGAGHLWPGGRQLLPPETVGLVSPDIDGARTIWNFATSVWSSPPSE